MSPEALMIAPAVATALGVGFLAGWLIRNRQDPITLEEQRRISAAKWEAEKRELEGNQAWEIRRLTARAEDAELERDKYKGAYKRSLGRIAKLRKQLGQASRQLQAAGLSGESEPNEDGSPKLDTVQGILDAAMTAIPGMDDMAAQSVRSYVERQLRSRGSKQGPQILEEVIAGDIEA